MKKKKLKIILKNLKKVVKPYQIIFIIVLLVGNTYAWFVYSSKVSNSIDVHVRSWNVLFKSGDDSVFDYYYVNIPSVFPGMDDFTDSLTIMNDSEVSATVSYEILEARIFDDSYVSVEGRIDNNEDVQEGDLTSSELEEMLSSDYPFNISFSLSDDNISEVIDSQIGVSSYSVNFVWPFESGDDLLDTSWGVRAYQYMKDNPDSSGIMLKIKIYVSQNK